MRSIILLMLVCFVLGTLGLNKQKDCDCKISNVKHRFEAKIVNGDVLRDQNSFPWIITIKTNLNPRIPMCEATIINERYALTSGDCADPDFDPIISFLYLQVRGIKKLVRIEKFIRHPGFMDSKRERDNIALIKLLSPIKFNQQAQPACLGVDSEKYFGPLTIAGHGSTTPAIRFSNGSLDESSYHFSKELRTGIVTDHTQTEERCKGKENELICVNGKSHLCVGEFGGGLHYTTNKTRVIGVGLYPNAKQVGDHKEYCSSGTAFTRLSAYIDFIKQVVGDEYCS